MRNLELAKIFYEIADILEMSNVQWKPQAYRKAARALEGLAEDVEEIYKSGGLKALEEIPGIGERLAEKIVEFIETGKIKAYKKLLSSIPKGLTQLMEVTGLGPKKAQALYNNLNIKNVKELEAAIKKHKVKGLFGFGEKTEKNIEEGIEILKKGTGRFLIGLELNEVEEIASRLRKLKDVNNIEVAGSFRRRKETIGDADILVTSSNPSKVMDFFVSMPEVSKVLAKGTTKSAIILKDDLQMDLRVVSPESFGSALQYFTGSKDHNIKLRQIAIKKGYKLSEYGLFTKENNTRIAGKTEEEVYNKLGLQIIAPELRENTGEIEAASSKKLPNLIDLKDIKGDLHMHTNWSDGTNTIAEIARAAKSLGYEYICITDHSKSTAIANGLTEDRLISQIKEVRAAGKKIKGIKILAGIEVDIKGDGSLDFDDGILKKLDLVTASIHSKFKMNQKKMTSRIVKALENKYVKVLNHPTGRIINKRNPYDLDFEQVLEVAKENNKFLEINCMPDRLDLNDTHIRKAVENGVKLVINTDAHNTSHLRYMQLGIWQARRGWATKDDVLNCLTLKKLQAIMGAESFL